MKVKGEQIPVQHQKNDVNRNNPKTLPGKGSSGSNFKKYNPQKRERMNKNEFLSEDHNFSGCYDICFIQINNSNGYRRK